MSQRDSGYQRKERGLYETPAWVTEALRPHLRDVQSIWEPAAGNGAMVRVFEGWGLKAIDYTDIVDGHDFLAEGPRPIEAIITNPPYNQAQEFIEHALKIMKPRGCVAMLLRTDFDHAKTRQHLFGNCAQFEKKLVLTKRIKWFADSTGSPSFNHAWYIWDWHHKGPPTLAYGPTERRLTKDESELVWGAMLDSSRLAYDIAND